MVALPSGVRPAQIAPPRVPRPAVAPPRRPVYIPPAPPVAVRDLRSARLTVILAVVAVSLAGITGYFVGRPPESPQAGRHVAAPGPASMAGSEGEAQRAYELSVRELWGSVARGLVRFEIAVEGGDLAKISSTAGELRVNFDVLAIDLRRLQPPKALEGLHGSFLAAIEHSATMFERADALAANALDADASTANAELLSAAAQQAEAAFESLRTQATDVLPRLNSDVWQDVTTISSLAAQKRTRQPQDAERSRPTGHWGSDILR